jgi:dihydroorotate dehydrogenase electron transfer subunit
LAEKAHRGRLSLKQAISTVIANHEITGYHLIWLDAPEIAEVARPGQFVMVNCGKDTLLPRPFSLHQRDGDRIALLFHAVGKGTDWLTHRQAGDKVALFGPLGNGFSINPDARNILLVAGGIGIAPLCFLADVAAASGCEVKLLAGARISPHLDIEGFFPPGIALIFMSEDGIKGKQGLITTMIPEYCEWADQVFACGPLPMYRTMAQMPELKNQPVQVSLEVRMGCGLGVCYGCTVKTTHGLKQVCKDGPVFNLHDVFWDGVAV